MEVADLDLSDLDPRLGDVEIVAVTDVRNPLTGPQGAAQVYGPQKGLTPGQVRAIDTAMQAWAQLLRTAGRPDFDQDSPGTGAAGGVGAAILGGLGGTLTPGAPFVLDAVGFDAGLATAQLVVTGEGSWDEQSLHGKAPAEVLRRAHARGVPAAIIAGRVASRDGLAELGVRSVTALIDLTGDASVAMRDAERLLEEAGAALGTAWRSLQKTQNG